MKHRTGQAIVAATRRQIPICRIESANQLITKDGPNKKRYKTIIVLHNAKVVPYTLFAETDDGILPVMPEEARAYKKLLLSWNKGTQG